mgnify:CR=1 FL=1
MGNILIDHYKWIQYLATFLHRCQSRSMISFAKLPGLQHARDLGWLDYRTFNPQAVLMRRNWVENCEKQMSNVVNRCKEWMIVG